MKPTSNGGVLPELSINELILSYWRFAEAYYSRDGEPTKELACMREALRPVRKLYGGSRARDFGPKALKAVRQFMVEQGLSRGLINHRVGRIKRVFKWAVAEELIPPSVHHALQAVTGLRYGRTEAREAEPVRPVKDKCADAVLHARQHGDHDQQEREGLAGHLRRRRGDDGGDPRTRAWC